MATLVKVLAAVALIFGGTVGTVSALQDSLPGALLYPVKMQYEDLRLNLTQDAASQVELAMTYAQNRVEEIESLVAQADEVPEDVFGRYQHQVQIAFQATDCLTEPLRLRTQAHLSGTLQSQVRTMARVMARLNSGSVPTETTQARIQAMVQVMTQAQQALGNEGHQGGEPGSGPNPGDNGNGSGGQCVDDCGGAEVVKGKRTVTASPS